MGNKTALVSAFYSPKASQTQLEQQWTHRLLLGSIPLSVVLV